MNVLRLLVICWALVQVDGAWNYRAMFEVGGDPVPPRRSLNLDRYGYRMLVRVGAAEYARYDRPIEVKIDFSKLGTPDESFRDADLSSLMVVEDRDGQMSAVPFQFDPYDDSSPRSRSKGILTFIMEGLTGAHEERCFYVYFRLPGGADQSDDVEPQRLVRVTQVAEHKGQESFRIESTSATYYYHQQGAGFATLLDRAGADWLSYHPGVGPESRSGSGGKYRGTPNMGHPEGYCHPGNAVSDSRILADGPVKVSIESKSNDGKMHCIWDVFPRFARMTVLRMRTPYWYLYEGTPGGELDVDNDFCVRPAAGGYAKTLLAERWNGDIPSSDGAEWVYFADPRQGRSAYIVHHDDEEVDSYWPMNGEMTVFGFGRLDLKKFMRTVPAHFTMGLVDHTEPSQVKEVIDGVFQPLTITIEPPEAVR